LADYFDASALIPLMVEEPDTSWCLARVSQVAQALYVSDFAYAEVGAAVSKFVRMELLEPEAGRSLLVRFDVWLHSGRSVVETTGPDIAEAGRLVRRFELKLRTPDALHLSLARRCAAQLVTRDQGMARAAAMIGLPVLTPP
jgi:uncharacterized protein